MDNNNLKEKNFEEDIERWLLEEGGYERGFQMTYNKDVAIDPTVLRDFITETQPKEWARYQKIYGADNATDQFYKVLQDDISRYGLIYVLRNGIDDRGVKLRIAYFAPASELNEDLMRKYRANRLHVIRQFAYSSKNHNTIDMVLMLNGIPVVAIELKNQLTGQSVEDSKRQWMEDRDPTEFLFHFNNRILAYFGVDLYEVAMTTQLQKDKTFFIPFNQGSNGAGNVGGAGNPAVAEGGYVTGYFWQQVLQRDALLSILQRYISVQKEEKLKIVVGKNGKEKEVKEESVKIIFPRFHQLDVVEKLTADTASNGAGKNYLIQHSAGSGKSNSIAWLTYRLASLHDVEQKDVFNTVFVITDRRVLNQQLQNTVLGFDHRLGQVEVIKDGDPSSKLGDIIRDGNARIVICTLHRFPYIYDKVGSQSGRQYAVIVDEAHSSQSGKSAEKTKAALADTDEALRELAEIEEKEIEQLEKEKDALMEDLLAQGKHGNLSFYAFTATPKPKTLQTFGEPYPDSENPGKMKYRPYHIYSMQQAIEEGFIKDVLQNFTPIATAYEIAKNVAENPDYEETPATRAIKAFHDNHQHVIDQKVEIMVEKIREVTLQRMNGEAKTMIVCASRAHALRYYMAMKDYCMRKGYDDVRPLVAFSGKLEFGGETYTESQLNSTPDRGISEERLPLYFASDLFNVLIVADKYQTGFDEPKLHTMFVDKRLKNVKAVQTLSRLNRWQRLKKDTFVFDFSNTADDIKKAFEPFYTATDLIEPVDVNYVYRFRKDIAQYHVWNETDEEAFYEIYKKYRGKKNALAALSGFFKPIMSRFEALDEEKRFELRAKVKNFVRYYSYMAQIARTFDRDLYKAYVFADTLYKLLPKTPHEKPDLSKKIMLVNSQFQVWKNESTDFTPWLAKEENLALLGEAIGIDISLEEKESTVGDFSVDIFAKEEGTGRNIIIENQLEDTNHDHLGKLITYASGKNAEIVIWIVKRARDEHRKAIEWLNNHTDDTAAFFLIEIELWKIGDSQPAAKFNVVERPNDWAKAIKANTNLTAGEALKLDFWQSFNAYAAEERPDFTKVFNLRKPQTWHWYDLSTGIGSVSVQYTVNTNNGKLTAGLTVFDEDHSLFEAFLEKDKELTELLGGAKIVSKESVKSARLYIVRSVKLKDKETWSADFNWLCDCGLKLRDFARKIAK